MDALDLLIADHNRVKGMFKRFKDAHEKDDAKTMELIAGKIVEELGIHMAIEEEIFYPAIQGKSDEITETVYEGVEEHHVAKMLVQELPGLTPGSDEWVAKVKVIVESVEHHVEEEESDMFPAVRSKTSADQREKLGARLEKRKVELGAPPMEIALDLTMEELMEKAKEQEIPGRSKMKKDELAATIDPRG